MSQSSSLDMSQWFEYAKVFGVVALLIFAFVEYRAFANSPVGKAMGKVLGAAFAALTWLAEHPVLAIFGIVLLLILGPIVSSFGSKARDKIREKVKDLLDKDRNGDIKRAMDGVDLSEKGKDLAEEARTAQEIGVKVAEADKEGDLPPTEKDAIGDAINRATEHTDTKYREGVKHEVRENDKSEPEAEADMRKGMEAAERGMHGGK